MAGIRLGGLGAGEIPSASKSAGKTKGPEEGEGLSLECHVQVFPYQGTEQSYL